MAEEASTQMAFSLEIKMGLMMTLRLLETVVRIKLAIEAVEMENSVAEGAVAEFVEEVCVDSTSVSVEATTEEAVVDIKTSTKTIKDKTKRRSNMVRVSSQPRVINKLVLADKSVPMTRPLTVLSCQLLRS